MRTVDDKDVLRYCPCNKEVIKIILAKSNQIRRLCCLFHNCPSLIETKLVFDKCRHLGIVRFERQYCVKSSK